MIHPLLRLAALAIALPASAVALAAWRIACPVPPGERMFGSGREWLRGKIRDFTRA